MVIAFAILVAWTIHEYATLERGMVVHKIDAETAQLASTLFFDKMTAIAQVTIALLGGAWAFLTLTDIQITTKDAATRTCLTLANFCLLFSLIA
jgi:hypothetical protein